MGGGEVEDVGEEAAEVGDDAARAAVLRARERHGEAALVVDQAAAQLGGLPLHALRLDEDRDGDDEAVHGLDHAQPAAVEGGFEVGHPGGGQPRPGAGAPSMR